MKCNCLFMFWTGILYIHQSIKNFSYDMNERNDVSSFHLTMGLEALAPQNTWQIIVIWDWSVNTHTTSWVSGPCSRSVSLRYDWLQCFPSKPNAALRYLHGPVAMQTGTISTKSVWSKLLGIQPLFPLLPNVFPATQSKSCMHFLKMKLPEERTF